MKWRTRGEDEMQKRNRSKNLGCWSYVRKRRRRRRSGRSKWDWESESVRERERERKEIIWFWVIFTSSFFLFLFFNFSPHRVPAVSSNFLVFYLKKGWDTRAAVSHEFPVSNMGTAGKMPCQCFPAQKYYTRNSTTDEPLVF